MNGPTRRDASCLLIHKYKKSLIPLIGFEFLIATPFDGVSMPIIRIFLGVNQDNEPFYYF